MSSGERASDHSGLALASVRNIFEQATISATQKPEDEPTRGSDARLSKFGKKARCRISHRFLRHLPKSTLYDDAS